ncbi:MAG: hypothetical protein GWN99_10735 [Gemmatimonadetes bacterium]|uniref:4-vinyl reductase 4VR domain-containing protein n=1 Tax=Candidatus Kutchimonas denitrificans TaxID=3056748 RepID=A0AAE4Z8W2_9BACT|nr:hypothetical protein [Gemmatimonadota bacterium]NIR74772.1 hypothetical protein [Candidatus Kutchimonas denitrificans]NIS01522.1 hypothetical protein [Gemmatimonadota bacterium]NIT67263.1 hypothetical protein [Gemmatimonadota bacterium]NIU52437.1 hypothetical protein [Gemmatimonadota bacterium]
MNGSEAQVDARLPLALLQALQHQDTPPEVLPEEDFSSFFPTRLGLSGVIEEQIRQFRRLARGRGRSELGQLESLLKLISRRPDAGEVLTAAGRRLAGYHFSGIPGALRRVVRRLPRSLRRRAARRSIQAARDDFLIATDSSVQAKPLELHAVEPITARVGEYGAACKLYESMVGELVERSGLGPARVTHTECHRYGHERCVWAVEES